MLFLTQSCLRQDQQNCAATSSRYYEATHNGLDAMVRRFVAEATLLSRDSLADVGPGSSRCAAHRPCLPARLPVTEPPIHWAAPPHQEPATRCAC